MLGRLRMNVDECIEDYKRMGDLIFGRPRLFSMRGPLPANRSKYNHEKLKEAVEAIVNHRLAGHGDHLGDHAFPSSQERCRMYEPVKSDSRLVSIRLISLVSLRPIERKAQFRLHISSGLTTTSSPQTRPSLSSILGRPAPSPSGR
jgi:hypothetical protein